MPKLRKFALSLLAVSLVSIPQTSQAENWKIAPEFRPKRMGIHATFIRLFDTSRARCFAISYDQTVALQTCGTGNELIRSRSVRRHIGQVWNVVT